MTCSLSTWRPAFWLVVLALTFTGIALDAGAQAQRPSLGEIQMDIEDLMVPIGVVVPFAGPSQNVPPGWLLCDGSEVSRTQFSDLFGMIGGLHGTGDGVMSFNLPDYRGRFLRGVDAGAGRDLEAAQRMEMSMGGQRGDMVGSVQGDATALPNAAFLNTTQSNHSHGSTFTTGSHQHTSSSVARAGSTDGDRDGSPGFLSVGTRTSSSNGSHSHGTSSAGSHAHSLLGGDAETRPQNAYVNYIIKH